MPKPFPSLILPDGSLSGPGLCDPSAMPPVDLARPNLRRYERIAPFYDLLDVPFERRRYRALRPLLFDGLTGRLLDAGVGTGRNFPFYPRGSSSIGIDLSPSMLARASAADSQKAELAPKAFSEQEFNKFFDTLPLKKVPASDKHQPDNGNSSRSRP